MRSKLITASALGVTAAALFVAAPAMATSSSHKVCVCHATGSKTHPYTFIQIDEHAVAAHQHHQDGHDIIGVKSKADCDKHNSTPTPTPTPSHTPSVSPTPSKSPAVLGAATEQPTALPETGAEAGLSVLIGLPAVGVAARAYLRSRRSL